MSECVVTIERFFIHERLDQEAGTLGIIVGPSLGEYQKLPANTFPVCIVKERNNEGKVIFEQVSFGYIAFS